MKREQVRAMIPILQAFIDGKKIEGRPKGFSNDFEGWVSVDEISGLDSIEYRIKPEPKYRPFNDAKECWQEMQKHQPFGWVVGRRDGVMYLIRNLEYVSVYTSIQYSFKDAFDKFAFADLVPFGIKVEENI